MAEVLLSCSNCNKTSKIAFDRHSETRKCVCDQCSNLFQQWLSLQREHTKGTAFNCDICENKLSVNSKNHTGDRRFRCEKCGKSYTRRDTLVEHLRLHTGERPFTCPTCGRTFTNRTSFRSHLKVHAKNDAEFLDCPLCDKKFLTRGNLLQHIRYHDGIRPFQCPTCPKAFKSHSCLRKHSWIHSETKQFSCDLCDIKFLTPNAHRIHIARFHKKSKIFECSLCYKEFSRKDNLAYHTRVVHEDVEGKEAKVGGPACPFCDRVLSSQRALFMHLRAHIGEAFYSCEVCDRAFIKAANFRFHQKVHEAKIKVI